MKKWTLRQNKIDIKKLAKAMGINETIAMLLGNRGLKSFDEVRDFLNPSLEFLGNSHTMKDMDLGVKTVTDSIKSGEKITVYGDYDVDGVSSTVILYKAIKALGGNVIYNVPDRQKEGYGLSMAAMENILEMGTELLVTCDNGIASMEEIKKAVDMGLKVVIIDHHEPAFTEENGVRTDILPDATAVIDPKQKECQYPFKSLCAGGLSYKFAKCLFEKSGQPFDKHGELLGFAALATICDIVDLVGENRIIAKLGLKAMGKSPNIGLKALIERTGLEGKEINEYHAGFVLGPAVNATGRLETAMIAIELFTTEDKERAKKLADELAGLNESRKAMTKISAEEAVNEINTTELKNQNVLVIYNENIHESIAGIVAGRVRETFYKPVIMLTKGEGIVKGSARSIEGYNIFEELLKAKHLFTKFGGHPMAAGLSMEEKNIEELRRVLNENENLTEGDLTEVLRIEKQLDFKDITLELIQDVNNMAPFGKSNPTPVFGSKNVICEGITIMGKNQNVLKFSLRSPSTKAGVSAIMFDGIEEAVEKIKNLYGEEKCSKILDCKDSFNMDIAYTLNINEFNGNRYIQLMVKDYRLL